MSYQTFGGDPPEKPSGDRESFTLTSLDVTLESATEDERELVEEEEPGEGSFDPVEMGNSLRNATVTEAKLLWMKWSDMLFAHRYDPTPLFDYDWVSKKGARAPVVYEDTHGTNERPVLKVNPDSKAQITESAKSVCLQYAVTSDKEPHKVCKEIPFDIFPTEVWRIRNFVDEHEIVWTTHDNREWWDRTPIGDTYQIEGVVYFMYTVENNNPIPRYVGLSKRNGLDGTSLNYGFANATQDSVMTRWGYGKGQHLGELSCALFEDQYYWDAKPKYKQWLNELFHGQTPVMKDPIYVEVLPWLSDSPIFGEENLVTILSKVYPDKLLNIEYADKFEDSEQDTLV